MQSKERILTRLQEHLTFAMDMLDIKEDQVVGIFLHGSQNYNLALNYSDVDSCIIILPTVEEMVLKQEWRSTQITYHDGEKITIKDIRKAHAEFRKQNPHFLEILFSEFFILNPTYEDAFKNTFLLNREKIAVLNPLKMIVSVVNMVKNYLKADILTNKMIYNGARLVYFLDCYINDVEFERCLKPSGITKDYLFDIRTGVSSCVKDQESMQQKKKDLIDTATMLENTVESTGRITTKQQDLEFNKIIVDFMQFYLYKKDTMNKTKIEDFRESLSKMECRALDSIIDSVNQEGNVSISELTKSTSISRPVYQNLFNKLKENKMAEIVSNGVKGTHIKFTGLEIKN